MRDGFQSHLLGYYNLETEGRIKYFVHILIPVIAVLLFFGRAAIRIVNSLFPALQFS